MAAASALVSSAAGDSRLGCSLGFHSQDMAEHGPSLLHHPLGQRRACVPFVEGLAGDEAVRPAVSCDYS